MIFLLRLSFFLIFLILFYLNENLIDVEKAEILSKYEINEKHEAVTSLQIQKHRLRQAKGKCKFYSEIK